MRLDRLLDGVDGVDVPPGASHVDVNAIAYDSRRVGAGALFCCVPGGSVDGHDFAAAAVAAGAVTLLVERPLSVDVQQVVVSSVRATMPLLAARFFGNPADGLEVVG